MSNKFRRNIVLLILILLASGLQAQKSGRREKNNNETLSVEQRQEVTNLFLDATKAKLTGNISKAINLYNLCLEKNPDHSATMFELASLYLNNNDLSSAGRLCKRAVELEPDNKWYKQLLADIYGQEGNHEELLKICRQLLDKEPDNAEYLYQLAQAYILDNDASNALKIYNKIEEIVGINEEISLQKHQILLYQKKTDEAVKELEKLISEFPEQQSRYYAMIAEMYTKQNNPEMAAEFYKKIIATDPGNTYVHISLSDYYHQKGDRENAFKELELGFSNPELDVDTKLRVLFNYYDPSKSDAATKEEIFKLTDILIKTHPNSAKVLSIKAMLYFEDNKTDEARYLLRQAISVDSSSYTVWETLLNAEIQKNDFQALASESERAIGLFPLQPVPYFFSGAAHFEKKEYNQAIEKLNTGIKLVVANNDLLVQFYTYLGDCYNAIKNYRMSDESFEKALKLNPENSYILNNYAYYLSLRNENLAKAETMALKATKLRPDNSANLDTYGWVLFKQEKYEEAKQWVEKAIQLSSAPDADLLEHLGDINFKIGDVNKAVENWNAAQKAGNDSPQLEKKILERKIND